MAGERIRRLLTQVEEQEACIANALVYLQTATNVGAQLSGPATEQHPQQARAETAERDRRSSPRQIEVLIAEMSRSTASGGDNDQAELVLCLGSGCGLPIHPGYVARTGFLWHGPCRESVPAARFSGRRVA